MFVDPRLERTEITALRKASWRERIPQNRSAGEETAGIELFLTGRDLNCKCMRVSRESGPAIEDLGGRDKGRKLIRTKTMVIFVEQWKRGNVSAVRKRLQLGCQLRANNVYDTLLDSIQEGKNISRRSRPNMTTVLNTRSNYSWKTQCSSVVWGIETKW